MRSRPVLQETEAETETNYCETETDYCKTETLTSLTEIQTGATMSPKTLSVILHFIKQNR